MRRGRRAPRHSGRTPPPRPATTGGHGGAGSRGRRRVFSWSARSASPNVSPVAADSSRRASPGSETLMVVMPMARAGFRLMPRSSRYTTSSGRTPHRLAGQLVDARDRVCGSRPPGTPPPRRTARRRPTPPAGSGASSSGEVVGHARRPNCSVQRRTASTMAGRMSPPSNPSTARPSTRWPSRRASVSKAAAKPSTSSWPRSRRDQALLSGSVELTRRMNPSGSPASCS